MKDSTHFIQKQNFSQAKASREVVLKRRRLKGEPLAVTKRKKKGEIQGDQVECWQMIICGENSEVQGLIAALRSKLSS